MPHAGFPGTARGQSVRAKRTPSRNLGLLPSTPERQTTDPTYRRDCEGNIYVCDSLGKPEDAGVRGTGSAHWWRDHLAQNNRFDDPDWVILEIINVKRIKGKALQRHLE